MQRIMSIITSALEVVAREATNISRVPSHKPNFYSIILITWPVLYMPATNCQSIFFVEAITALSCVLLQLLENSASCQGS